MILINSKFKTISKIFKVEFNLFSKQNNNHISDKREISYLDEIPKFSDAILFISSSKKLLSSKKILPLQFPK